MKEAFRDPASARHLPKVPQCHEDKHSAKVNQGRDISDAGITPKLADTPQLEDHLNLNEAEPETKTPEADRHSPLTVHTEDNSTEPAQLKTPELPKSPVDTLRRSTRTKKPTPQFQIKLGEE